MNDEQEKVQARIHSLGQQIRAHRIAQNLSQQRLALMVHTDQAVIARIEAGKHNTGIAKYIEIADALDVPIEFIVIQDMTMNDTALYADILLPAC
ncbi:helix-turn-helix transcriptional regulator, partial [Adlercreutzia sp. DFI.6.23]|uniref:helix-turn-helix transcriptional regulator n=1 Tax=Adlercreutzia sp. DFI.6.23 TaxID=2963705 RepID=UPI00210B338A